MQETNPKLGPSRLLISYIPLHPIPSKTPGEEASLLVGSYHPSACCVPFSVCA